MVNITVTSVNDAPLALNDIAIINEDGTLNGSNLLSNDSDPEGNTLTIQTTPVTAPAYGSLTINTNGTYTYTPTGNYNGSDSFTYEVCDNGTPSLCATATVNITVTSLNDAPLAVNDVATIGEDGILNGPSLLSNDSDPDGNILTISTTPVIAPSHGTLTINANGTYTYIPAANYNGNDSFTYQVCDNGTPSLCSSAVVVITVTSVNDAPITLNDVATVGEDGTLNGASLLANDSDPDGNLLTIQTTPVIAPSHGTLIINSNGTYTYTPAANYNGDDSFTYQVCDNGTPSLCAIAVVNITVTSVNDAPVAANDVAIVEEDGVLNGTSLLSNDNDPDGNTLMIKTTPIITPSHGTVTINSNGTYTYIPAANFNGSDSFTYQVCDNGLPSMCSSAVVNITITAVNDPPIAVNDSKTTNEDVAVTLNVTTNDTDVDGTIDVTTVDLDPATLGIQTSYTDSNGNQWNVNSSGEVIFTPALNYSGTATINYTVNDNSGAVSNIGTITITVKLVNNAPVAINDNVGTSVNTPVTTDILANDYDIDGNLVPSSVVIITLPLHGTTSVNAITGAVTYTPNTGYFGTDSYVYMVCDTNGACAQATVAIQVPAIAPVAVNDTKTTNEDNPVSIDVIANDYDPQGDFNYSSVSVVSTPSHGIVTVNATTGVITYTSVANFNGTDQFTYQVCDLTGFCSQALVKIIVNPVNDAPVAINDIAFINEGETLNGSNLLYNDSDPEGNTLTIKTTPVIAPAHGTLTINANGTYTYIPATNYYGSDSFTYQVCDNGTPSSCATAIVNITVTSVNDAPLAVNDFATIAEDGTLNGTSLLANDSDPDGNILTIKTTPVIAPSHGILTINANGTYTYIPAANYNGSDSFSYEVCDNGTPSLCATATVNITVTSVNDTPKAVNDVATVAEEGILNGTSLVANDSDPDGNTLTIQTTPVIAPLHGTLTINVNGTYTYRSESVV